MHTSTPQFITVCRLLVRKLESIPRELQAAERDSVLSSLMEDLKQQGLVFDRSLAAELFDRLVMEPALADPEQVERLRRKVQEGSYFSEGVLETLGDRILRSFTDFT